MDAGTYRQSGRVCGTAGVYWCGGRSAFSYPWCDVLLEKGSGPEAGIDRSDCEYVASHDQIHRAEAPALYGISRQDKTACFG